MSFAALVLAGTRPGGDPLAEAEGVAAKALVTVDGEAMLSRVIGAVRGAGAGRIVVACDEGPVAELARAQDCEVVQPARGPAGSVQRGLDVTGAPLLVTTADHALLQPGWVRAAIEGTPDDADVGVMLARREAIKAELPGSRRTYLRFADGHWSGCNLFFLRTPDAAKAIAAWQGIEADRKRPWRIVAKLGLGTLLDYALGRLTLAEGIARLGKRIGVRAALVEAPSGLAAVDADKPSDLADIRAILARQQG
ncbi:nucleotidyltransferase family protein [Paraurantiacibacter namhicola]|uniref:2-phospho-L-lactate guanylyltransferase n=1 Tax=Paraurantiacibacter namhicola TaxID=645517 RepID=A0A1C7D9S6_9SPHN|nr:nucleotidyltransferase family protein [Paraurantiacibacter namhicola]ANU08122.1 2-phospho-L-lactate guanylyltransferase [Paraurantiacibacter namhicola]